jgi:hypothetical protein
LSLAYEDRSKPPISRGRFLRRVLVHFAAAMGLLIGSIALGMAGYAYFEHLPPLDAFLNTTMLLGGMGPVDPPLTAGGKLFAGFFALYCGVVFLIMVGLMLTPVVHRLLHKFHWGGER